MQPQNYIASFDSASGMQRALARYLQGKAMGGLSTRTAPFLPLLRVFATLIEKSPERLREALYSWGGWREGVPAEKIAEVDMEAASRWMTEAYPKRRYPALALGAPNGALNYLWSALGIPWLPQTFLVPVRRSGIHPDDAGGDLEWGIQCGEALLQRNADVQIHQMHDPNQDRLMVGHMAYYRIKRRVLGLAYERFIQEHLQPGGTLFVSECTLDWGVHRVASHFYFQQGGMGGVSEDEYHLGSDRVRRFLRDQGSPYANWNPPRRQERRPEAEWGFESALLDDVEGFARRHGYRVRRVVFEQPEAMSPLVADLYRWWYAQRGIDAQRLFVSCFILLEPFWTLRTGSVPFWTLFNTDPSAQALRRYLDDAPPFEKIFLSLFSHGVQSIGLTPLEEWRRLIDRARSGGDIVGIDPKTWPKDFGNFVRYAHDLAKRCRPRLPLPPSLTLAQLDGFLARHSSNYAARWIDLCDARRGSVRRARRAPALRHSA